MFNRFCSELIDQVLKKGYNDNTLQYVKVKGFKRDSRVAVFVLVLYTANVLPSGTSMATDIVAQLADSLAKTAVEDGELSYKGQGRKLDDAQSGECKHFIIQTTSLDFINSFSIF